MLPDEVGKDLIREFCRESKFSDAVIDGGLGYLVKRWENNVKEIENVGQEDIYDYLNDMDGRRIISQVLPLATNSQLQLYSARIAEADRRFIVSTVSSDICVWGKKAAAANGWNSSDHWWYFRHPRNTPVDWSLDNY